MKKKPLHRISSLLAATVLGLFLLTGCAEKSTEAVQAQEDADTIQVYLWTNSLYEKYAPYVPSLLAMPTISRSSMVRALICASSWPFSLCRASTSSSWSPMRNTGFSAVIGSWKIMEI